MNNSDNPIYSPTTLTQLRFLKEKIGSVQHVPSVANEIADMLSRNNSSLSLNDVKLIGNETKNADDDQKKFHGTTLPLGDRETETNPNFD